MNRRNFLKTSTIFLGSLSLLNAKEMFESKILDITLNNGVKMPQFGYGTWKIQGEEGKQAILEAFRAGYRLIDSASAYRNESEVGEAFRQSGLNRSEVFITTKIARESDTLEAFNASLSRLQMDYVDLYLLHWSTDKNIERYKICESLYEKGKIRAIGVSNFSIRDLENLMSATNIIPAVNQIKLNPFVVDSELIKFCRLKGIAIEAYTPLTNNISSAQNNPTLKSIALKHNKSVAQILLRWSIQSGYIVIPRSSNAGRIRENIDIFDFALDSSDMSAIDKLKE